MSFYTIYNNKDTQELLTIQKRPYKVEIPHTLCTVTQREREREREGRLIYYIKYKYGNELERRVCMLTGMTWGE